MADNHDTTTPDNLPPPVPPEKVPPIVDTLDPDLAAAYRAGNPTIIQAVANGMTTSAMVVNEVIRMGGAMNGLPPAVQTLVNERRREMEEQAALENERLRKLVAGVVGMGVMATGMAAGAEEFFGSGAKGYSATNPPSSEQFSQMSDMEKMAYLTSVRSMSTETWTNEMTKTQREQTLTNIGDYAHDRVQEAGERVKRVVDDMQKDGLSESDQDLVRSVIKVGKPNTPEGRAAIKANVEALAKTRPELAKYAEEYGTWAPSIFASRDAENEVNYGKDANHADKHEQSKAHADTAVREIERDEKVIRDPSLTIEARNNASRSARIADATQLEVNKASPQEVDAAMQRKVLAGMEVSNRIDAAQVATVVTSASMEDETVSRAPSITASSLGAKGSAGLALLGAKEPVTPVASPEGPEMVQRRPAASAGAGMGA